MAFLLHGEVYSKLEQDEESGDMNSDRGTCSLSNRPRGFQSFSTTQLICFSISLCLYSFVMVFLGVKLAGHWNPSTDCSEVYDVASPIFHRVNTTLTSKVFSAKFWPGSEPPLLRQPPSAAVDAEWERITNGRDIVLSSAEVRALGKDPSKTVKARPEWGFGDDAHFGYIGVLHQLHCLNVLRKGIYYNHYYRNLRGFGANPPDDYRAKYYSHMDHCIFSLMETLTCASDLTMTTYNWMEGEHVPEADFQATHQCRDFDGLLKWHKENNINANLTIKEQEVRWATFEPLPGDIIIPQDPEANASFWDVNLLDLL